VPEAHQDYRARATRGVAFAALTLLLPFTLYALVQGMHVFAVGGAYINVLLLANTWLVARGRDHEAITLFGLVPGGTAFMGLSLGLEGSVASAWCFPSVLACYCMLGGRRARIGNAIILSVAVPMAWSTMDAVDAVPFVASLLAVSLFASILVREIDAQQQRLRFQLDHDPLTGLLNRSSLTARLDSVIHGFGLSHMPATLLAIDLDHFKQINDALGHETGDRVLCEVARLLRRELGEHGAIFRTGGEEFLVLLPDHDGAMARRGAERVRLAIRVEPLIEGGTVTASIGVASLRVGEGRQSWMRRADERLYEAKRGGRDRVMPALRTGALEPIESEPLPMRD